MLFRSGTELLESLEPLMTIEFGGRPHFRKTDYQEVKFNASPQPPFRKDFERLAADLLAHQRAGSRNLIAAEWPRQHDRLREIFSEIHPELIFGAVEFSLREGFADQDAKLVVYTDHQIFERFHRYRQKEKFSKSKAITLRELQALQPGDFVTHIDFEIGRAHV